MMQMNLRNIAIATSTVAGVALLSFSWSEQSGVSLSVESAQARVGRPLTPMSAAGVARRQNRRAAYGYGYGARYGYGYGRGVVGAGLAGAAAVGTAAAVAATSPWGGPWGSRPYAYGGYGGYTGNSYAYYSGDAGCIPGTYYVTGGLVQICK